MPDVTITNWFGNVVSHPNVVVDAHSLEDIIAILKDADRYPSPVRAVGSNHSTSACAVAEGGTVVRMKMKRILHVGADTVTVEAGAIYIDIEDELRKHNLQFHLSTEIGNLTAGSAACCGTKDSSFPGEYGQVSSYAIGVRMVLPSGELLEVTEDEQPELMRKIRSSYGTFGIVYQATFRVRPMTPMAVRHQTFHIDDFIRQLPELKKLECAMFFFMFPAADKITVEFRHYNPGATGTPNRGVWRLRNFFWSKAAPAFGNYMENLVPIPSIRYGIIDGFNAMTRLCLDQLIHSDNTIAPDQTIRYPDISNNCRYTFSLFAFPEEIYPEAIKAYYEFNKDYYRREGFRTDMLSVGYRIAQDQQSLLSYSYPGTVMTLDPVSTAKPGWDTFLDAYNQFCSARGGFPLLNQTARLNRPILIKAFGDRLDAIAEARRHYDPTGRLLSDYFRELLESGAQNPVESRTGASSSAAAV